MRREGACDSRDVSHAKDIDVSRAILKALESSESGALLVHIDGDEYRILWANAAVSRMAVEHTSPVIGGSLASYFGQNATQPEYQRLVSLLTEIRPGRVVLPVNRFDGSQIMAEVLVSPAASDSTSGRHALLLINDITERVISRSRLTWLSAAVEQSPVGIVLLDANGRVGYVNPAYTGITGMPAELVLGHQADVLLPEPAQMRAIRRTLATGRPWHGDLQGVDHTERKFWASLYVCPIFDDHGAVIGYLAVVEETTQRRESEEQLRQLVSQVENVNQELQSFAYIVSHDLKAPLRSIHNLADWLMQDYCDRLDAEGRDMLQMMQSRVNRLQRLIDAVLQYSRVGRTDTVVNVDLSRILADVCVMLDPPPTFTIRVNPMPTVRADELRMTQLFQNLLDNAMKYGRSEGGYVEVSAEREGDWWHVVVADNGPGIEPRHHERIFGIFQTLQTRDEHESTGVGLSLAKRIVENYGGRIWVVSEPGAGAAFHFTLPVATDESEVSAGNG